MGVFSRLFSREDGGASLAGDSSSGARFTSETIRDARVTGASRPIVTATETNGFAAFGAGFSGKSSKRARSAANQTAGYSRVTVAEALWIPLPDLVPVSNPDAAPVQVPEGYPDYAEFADYVEYDEAPLTTTQRVSKRPPPLPSTSKRDDASGVTRITPEPVLLIPVADVPPAELLEAQFFGYDAASEEDAEAAFHAAFHDEPAGQTQTLGEPKPQTAPLHDLIDAAVDALIAPDGVVAAHAGREHAGDRAAVMELFAGVAKVHGRPLRELMFQLSVGSTPRTWASACRPLLRPLTDAAQQMDWSELTEALVLLDAALENAAVVDQSRTLATDDVIDPAASEAIQLAYEQLRLQMPDVFSSANLTDTRRLILLESLLLQVPTLHRRTIAKLYAAGLSSVQQLSEAKPEELTAVVSGLDHALAVAIIEHLRRFEQERSRVDPTLMRGHIQTRLRATVGRLGQLQIEFERAENEGSPVRKKAVRRAREAAVLELQRLLAEVGDLGLLEELKRYSVRGKLLRLQNYLQQLQAQL
ncbi:MAG: hypothetical protein RL701_4502 [Pseudomonadota bacterium]